MRWQLPKSPARSNTSGRAWVWVLLVLLVVLWKAAAILLAS